jgi:hypothetical protein
MVGGRSNLTYLITVLDGWRPHRPLQDFAPLVQVICETELLNGEVTRVDAAARL